MDAKQTVEAHRGKPFIKGLDYLPAYDRHLTHLRGTAPTIVEIGILAGGSLQFWADYLGPGTNVHGVDINPDTRVHADTGATIHIGDQGDPVFLDQFAANFDRIDIVVDDGGHTAAQQITTFERLWPLIPPGGVYLCEDTASSYLPDFGSARDGQPHPGSFVEYLRGVVDAMHAWFVPDASTEGLPAEVASVCVYRSLVVVERADMGVPQVAGSTGREMIRGPWSPDL